MELDFTGLARLAQRGPLQGAAAPAPEPQETDPPGLDQIPGGGRLQIEADRQREAAARSLEICKEYQENIKRTGQLQTEISKGLLRGEDIYQLFLKAVDALGLVVHDKSLLSRTRETLIDVYGHGLQEPRPLEIELEAIEGRIKHMEGALTAAGPDTARNIKRAIAAHREQAEGIRRRLSERKEMEERERLVMAERAARLERMKNDPEYREQVEAAQRATLGLIS